MHENKTGADSCGRAFFSVWRNNGKSLDEIKKELRMPEYDSWASKDRIPSNIDAAYKVIKGN
jgi:hypothetical protein